MPGWLRLILSAFGIISDAVETADAAERAEEADAQRVLAGFKERTQHRADNMVAYFRTVKKASGGGR